MHSKTPVMATNSGLLKPFFMGVSVGIETKRDCVSNKTGGGGGAGFVSVSEFE